MYIKHFISFFFAGMDIKDQAIFFFLLTHFPFFLRVAHFPVLLRVLLLLPVYFFFRLLGLPAACAVLHPAELSALSALTLLCRP